MSGAVDLSGLKQRAQAGPAPAAGADGTAGSAGVEITEANFEAEVLVRSDRVPVVVLLWSPRSEASAQLGGYLSTLNAEDKDKPNGGWTLASVNVDTTPRVAQAFGVQAVPTVVALAGGQPVSSFQGVQPPDQLRQWIDSLVNATAGKLGGSGDEPAEVDPAVAAARDHLEAGDFDAARDAYQAILATDPNNAEAKGAVHQITFLTRATTRSPDAVALADAAPTDIEAAFAAADVQILNQDVAAAFNRLIALVRSSAGEDRTTVRTRVLELFELFDPADPDIVVARRNLASALF